MKLQVRSASIFALCHLLASVSPSEAALRANLREQVCCEPLGKLRSARTDQEAGSLRQDYSGIACAQNEHIGSPVD